MRSTGSVLASNSLCASATRAAISHSIEGATALETLIGRPADWAALALRERPQVDLAADKPIGR